MEITEEMLDIIEQVKGKRNPGLWDPRCHAAMANKKKSKKPSVETTVKPDSKS